MQRYLMSRMSRVILVAALCLGSEPLGAASRPAPAEVDPLVSLISPDGALMLSTDALSTTEVTSHQFIATTIEVGAMRSLGALSYRFAYPTWQPDSSGVVVLRLDGQYSAEKQIVRLAADGTGVTSVTQPFLATCQAYFPTFTNCTQLAMVGFAHDASVIYSIAQDYARGSLPLIFYQASPAQPIERGRVPGLSQCALTAAGYWIVCRTPRQIVRIATTGAIRQEPRLIHHLSYQHAEILERASCRISSRQSPASSGGRPEPGHLLPHDRR